MGKKQCQRDRALEKNFGFVFIKNSALQYVWKVENLKPDSANKWGFTVFKADKKEISKEKPSMSYRLLRTLKQSM